jgi:hypothetical protein
VLLFIAIGLVQPYADYLEICLLSRDVLIRDQPDAARYRLTDPRLAVKRELAAEGPVAPTKEVLRFE